MIDEYKKLGCKKGTFKVELELPNEFKRDFTEVGMFENKNKMAECFDRIMDEKIRNDGIMATIESESYLNKKIEEAVESIKKDFIEAMRAEMIKLQTYKMFPYEDTVYVERDDVLRIFDKYKAESEEEE